MDHKRARELRRKQTEAERKLWGALRNKQMKGFKFRRQQPIGPYIADFVCFESKLIIEVDGGQHLQESEHDARRSEWLRREGFTIIRFWNHEVLVQLETVKQRIWDELG